MYKYSKRSNPNKGFHYNPRPFPAKFGFVEISPMRIFVMAKFQLNEISLQWMRNFAKITAKFRLTQRNSRVLRRKFVAKFRRIFARTKNEKHRISFAFLLHSTVVFKYYFCFFLNCLLMLILIFL